MNSPGRDPHLQVLLADRALGFLDEVRHVELDGLPGLFGDAPDALGVSGAAVDSYDLAAAAIHLALSAKPRFSMPEAVLRRIVTGAKAVLEHGA